MADTRDGANGIVDTISFDLPNSLGILLNVFLLVLLDRVFEVSKGQRVKEGRVIGFGLNAVKVS